MKPAKGRCRWSETRRDAGKGHAAAPVSRAASGQPHSTDLTRNPQCPQVVRTLRGESLASGRRQSRETVGWGRGRRRFARVGRAAVQDRAQGAIRSFRLLCRCTDPDGALVPHSATVTWAYRPNAAPRGQHVGRLPAPYKMDGERPGARRIEQQNARKPPVAVC
jgi:hypothetical protein